jgi:hypothetical protein
MESIFIIIKENKDYSHGGSEDVKQIATFEKEKNGIIYKLNLPFFKTKKQAEFYIKKNIIFQSNLKILELFSE